MSLAQTDTVHRMRIAVLTADGDFARSVQATFGANARIDLQLAQGCLSTPLNDVDFSDATVVIVDIDATSDDEMLAMQRLTTRLSCGPPIIVVTQSFDNDVARALLQMRVADFLVKPVAPVDLVRACARVAKKTDAIRPEAQIYTFLPASGGAGVTTLAVQTAMLLLKSRGSRRPATCLVDLDFQHGAVADYLDLEARLNLNEIEPRPERLDRQLLEVMLSHHESGLAVIAAPNRPAEMRSFDPAVVTRLLDLVSGNFEYVVFDMPRTWFSWTDSVLLGSNNLFIVSEATVPGLRHAKHLVGAITERLSDGPRPRVIVNRFQQKMLSSSLRRADLEKALGDAFVAAIPNDYALVREAIDRGVPLDDIKPGNNITRQIKKLVLPQTENAPTFVKSMPFLKKLRLSFAQ